MCDVTSHRYDDIVKGLTPFLKQCGYNPKKDLTFIPISALHGHNIKTRAGKEVRHAWCGHACGAELLAGSTLLGPACAVAATLRHTHTCGTVAHCRTPHFWRGCRGCVVCMWRCVCPCTHHTLITIITHSPPNHSLSTLPCNAAPSHCLCHSSHQLCPWYDGPTLFETLDNVEVQQR
jgi:translation elongation factor EF-1alpha